MGNSHSDAASSGGSNTTPSGCGCCLSPRPQFSQLLAKLRRTLTRHLRPRKRRGGGVGGFQRGCGARTALLRPMPRCSSFGSCSTLLMPPKQQQQQQPTQADNNYAQWKCMFEHASGKRQLPAAPRPHDISEALSGQTTPRGFPSHTDARRCPQHEELMRQQQQEPPLYEECVVGDVKVRSRLSFRLPGSSQSSVRRLTARQQAAQAKLEEQLQRELCDLEEYYGGFYYARRNERRI